MLPGLSVLKPLTYPTFNDPVGKEKAEYAGNEKEAVEDCFWHFAYLNLEQSRDLVSLS